MSDLKSWNYYNIKNHTRVAKEQLINAFSTHPKPYSVTHFPQEKMLGIAAVNNLIAMAITENKPFWAGRYGQTEMNMIYSVLQHRMHPQKDNRHVALKQLCNNAGFFPNEIELGEKFVDLMLSSCRSIDLHGVWSLFMEDYMVSCYEHSPYLSRMGWLEPWYLYDNTFYQGEKKPWTLALTGKKVLVIHPFARTITKQYQQNRQHIFSRIDKMGLLLPDFELYTLQAVQTIGDSIDVRFSNWFDALNWMLEEIQLIEFDVAIIGCGAYGFPLASKIKEMGKVAIHLGGSTQLLFGIIGKRWESDNFIADYIYNEYWVRPDKSEQPLGKEKIEEGCYW